ncbi:hypothetical protein [Streptomyces sp. GESEQ-35]|uniref:hypothetical protein n=1 Tax=Streptomyces sp. GESEQ-35 TaxID=2812657 RepID=UPI001B326D16|nr:hypothetical protein [Streptomyces sp. GESEQ-35]
MPADEVTHGADVDEPRVRTGPRHAAPKKPLFTRFHVPAGKAIALAAMPTAVLMGMGFTPKLALADDQPLSNSQKADEYKDCVAALEDEASAGASPSTSASASESAEEAEPSPSASSTGDDSDATEGNSSGGKDSSSDSGSDDGAEPTPSATASGSGGSESGGDTATATPSPSESGGGLLEGIGEAISGIFTGGESASASPSPSATPSASASESAKASSDDAVKETTDKVTDTVENTVKDTTDTASKAAEDTQKTVEDAQKAVEKAAEAAEGATESATPSPSASSTTNADDCPAATDEEGGVDNKVLLPDDPWYLDASSLLLKGADYQGVVEVKTANGTKKKVLKYVISDGTEIGDLHQTVKDKQSGKTYHVAADEGTKSTISDGKTTMYTESISGNLFGLVPITFDPENPPPLNIPLIYFTKVKVVQAGQFGGTLTVPGLSSWQD